MKGIHSVADRCRTIYNGVDVDRFAPRPGPNRADEQSAKRLLFVGRVSPEKGGHVLAKALEVVMERNAEVPAHHRRFGSDITRRVHRNRER